VPAKDRTFRPTTDAAYKDELSERRKTGNFKNVVGDDPVAVIVKAQIELTVDATTSDQRLPGRPVNRAHLGKLLDFVVANQYRLGWEMVPAEKRRGRPVKKKDIKAIFPTPPAWKVEGVGVPQRVGTGAHRHDNPHDTRPPLVEAAAKHLGVSVERAGDLARQLADMAGKTPEGMIGKDLPDPN